MNPAHLPAPFNLSLLIKKMLSVINAEQIDAEQ